MNNSHVYLKGIKEPLEVTSEQAKKLTDIFFNDSISGSFVINMNDNSFRKSEIRYIRKASEKSTGTKEHWIIINVKRPSIWKQPYFSFQEAKAEFDYQVSLLHQNQKHNFVIEHRGFFDSENPNIKNIAVIEKDKDFFDFDSVKQSALNNF